jgi:hypothetical protein
MGARWRVVLAAVVVACLAVAAAGEGAAERGGSGAEMKRLLVIAGGKAAHAQVGSYCLRSGGTEPGATGTQECSSVAYDRTPRPVFRVAAGSTVAACAGRPASRVRVALVHDSREGPTELSARKARRLDKEGQCWRSKLPRRLGAASSIDIRVDYGRAGHAHFVVGIAPVH